MATPLDSTLHTASDARGGTPTDQALAAVAEWQRARRENTRLMFAAINTGLEQIESGKTEDGIASVRAGLDFLRPMIGGGQ